MAIILNLMQNVLPQKWTSDNLDGEKKGIEFSSSEFLLTVGIAAFMGILYGVFVQPLWSEAVEFGQVWAGTVRYETTNPWYQSIVGAPSLQITIPALFLRAGLDPWILCLATTAFFCAASFAAVAAACYVFSRHLPLSVCMPLLMLSYIFTDNHGYGMSFPVTHFQFGQTGQYLALLSFSFASCGFPIVAGIFGGLLCGIHVLWGLAFALGAFPIIALFQPLKTLKRLSIAFTLFFAISIFLQAFGESVFPPKLQTRPPEIPSEVIALVSNANSQKSESKMANTATSGMDEKVIPPKPEKKQRGTFQGHNILFSDKPAPLKAAGIFFLPTILFFILVLVFFASLGEWPSSHTNNFFCTRQLVLMVAVPIGLAILFKIVEEADPSLTLLGIIDGRLPGLALRAIFPRWLNLTTLLIPISALGCLVVLARERRSWLASLGFVVFLIPILLQKPWFLLPLLFHKSIYYAQGAFLFSTIFAALIALKIKTKNLAQGVPPVLIVTIVLVCFFLVKGSGLSRQVFLEQRYLGIDGTEDLVKVAKSDSGTLIISPEVVSVRGFNPQLRTERPIIVPTMLAVYNSDDHKIIHVFCYTDPFLPFDQFYANIRPCFENRSPGEWVVIRKELRATGIITPDTWNLNIPKSVSSGGFSYYRIPEGSHRQINDKIHR